MNRRERRANLRSPAPERWGTAEPPLPLLRLFPDCMAEWPLWAGADGGMVDAEHLGLSEDLTRLIAFWNEHFQQGYRYDRRPGWGASEDERWHLEVGVDLFHRLSRELEGRYRIEHDAWAVDP